MNPRTPYLDTPIAPEPFEQTVPPPDPKARIAPKPIGTDPREVPKFFSKDKQRARMKAVRG